MNRKRRLFRRSSLRQTRQRSSALGRRQLIQGSKLSMRATTGSRQESLVLKSTRRSQPMRHSQDEESGSGPIAVPKPIVISCLTAKSDRSSGRVYQTLLMRVSEVEQGLMQKSSAKLEAKKIFPGILRRGHFGGWFELF